MRFFSITAQTIDIGKDGVGEMIVFINEKINLLVHFGTFHIEIFQLIDRSIFGLHFFFYAIRQIIGIDITEVIKNSGTMVIQSLSIVVQFGTYQ